MGATVKARFIYNDRPPTAITLDGTLPDEPSADGGRHRGASGKILTKFVVDEIRYANPFAYFIAQNEKENGG